MTGAKRLLSDAPPRKRNLGRQQKTEMIFEACASASTDAIVAAGIDIRRAGPVVRAEIIEHF